MSFNINDLETGDMLLFSPSTKTEHGIMKYLDWMIQSATDSSYTHVAFVLKDPTFIHPVLKGLYIWESSYEGTPDPQDDKIKFGVQITPLHQCIQNFNGKIFVRKMTKGENSITSEKLQKIHNIVYDKPYDIMPTDWIQAWVRKDYSPQKTDRFWCSALVSYILVKLGMLDSTLDWSMIRPSDLSSSSNYLKFTDSCCYGDDTCLS